MLYRLKCRELFLVIQYRLTRITYLISLLG
nr:MAG TPA: hypothetical protein [Caudoviricetes sp.]